MKDMTKITEEGKKLIKVLRTILVEQTEEEEYYKISPQEFEELMKLSGYHGKGLSKIKKFQGKPIWITGDLDLSNTPTDSLGSVKYIDGKLDIRNTNISDLSGITIKSYTWDSGTPIEKKRILELLRKQRQEADYRRQNNEWNIEDGDTVGLKAHALFKHLVNSGDVTELNDEEKEELKQKKSELQVLGKQYDDSEEHDEDLYNRISDLESEVEEIESKAADVYNIIPMKYSNYGLTTFETIDIDDTEKHEYAVGDEEETDEAAYEYAKNYIDEVGIEGFRQHFIEQYLDEDSIRDYFEEYYNDDVRENPEIYFSTDDFQLSDEQKERVEELEEYIEKINGIKSRIEEKQGNLEQEIEDPDEYSRQYDLLQNKIDACETQIENAQEEIDNMEPDENPSEEMISEKVDEMVEDKMRDPADSLTEFGGDIKDYVDLDGLARGLVESDGYGIIGSYDGSYDTEDVDGVTYYIFRIN
jgi:outer membrane protein OmpA-like peptidoglycan-associated protein